MKKIILILVVTAGLSASCQKSYTCSCYDSTSNVTTTSTVKSASLTGAQSDCIAKNTGTTACAIQ